jgi:hypothetical protein
MALFKAEKAKSTPCLIKRFEGMSKDVEKSLDEQRLLEEKLKNVWLENLSQRFSISSQNKDLCKRKFSWFFSQAKIRVLGSKDKPILTLSQAARVMEKIEEYRVVVGQAICPFKFLQSSNSDEEPLCSDFVVAEALRYRWGDPDISDSAEAVFEAKLAREGADCLHEIAVATYQTVFKKMVTVLEANSDINVYIANTVIQNMLAFLPYVRPQEGQLFTLPVYKNDDWVGIEYKLERIKVSSDEYPFSPYYAYGLMPTDLGSGNVAHLIFKGTTSPFGTEGGFFSILADSNPFHTVGIWAFNQGYKAIESFVKKAHEQTRSKIVVQGHSLGACMALHTAIHLGDYVKQVYAFCPPAFYRKDLVKWEKKVKLGDSDLPSVHVFRQKFDKISVFGSEWGTHWDINYVHSLERKSIFQAHVRMGVASDHVLLAQVRETVRPSFERSLLFFVHMIAGSILFFIGLALIEIIKFSRKATKISSKISSHLAQMYSRVPNVFFHKKTLVIAA